MVVACGWWAVSVWRANDLRGKLFVFCNEPYRDLDRWRLNVSSYTPEEERIKLQDTNDLVRQRLNWYDTLPSNETMIVDAIFSES